MAGVLGFSFNNNLKSGDDLNNLTTTGFYIANESGILNMPTDTATGYVLNLYIASGNIVQILFQRGTASLLYIRGTSGGTFKSWMKLTPTAIE